MNPMTERAVRAPGATRRAAGVGAVLVAVLAAGCAPTHAPSGTSSPSSSVSAGVAGLVSITAKPSPDAQPTTPAPSTAGDLSAASLPASYLGFTAKERPPAESEFVPNGTWVHAVAAEQAAMAALPMCPGNTGASPVRPSAALMGSYLDGSGRPGNGLALSFGSPADALTYATTYEKILTTCTSGSTTAVALGSGNGWYAGRRTTQGAKWTEGIGVRDSHVLLMIVQDDQRSTAQEATSAARSLAGR